MSRLLISVRGSSEAIAAANGGADIVDVEDPSSALGTPYPLNIKAVRDALNQAQFEGIPISTNIGEEQRTRSSACQGALGVSIAGADYIKCGFAGLEPKTATYLARNVVRTVREWRPKCKVYPVVFPEEEFAISFDPLVHGPTLVHQSDCDGLLIDTYEKDAARGLLDFYDLVQLEHFASTLQEFGKEAWLAGGITEAELPEMWTTGADVVCVRRAACEETESGRMAGRVSSEIVRRLVATIPAT